MVPHSSTHLQELSDLIGITLAVNNAGYVLGVEKVGEISPEDIEGMFATNGEALALLCIAYL